MSDVLEQVVMTLSIAGFSAICGFGAYLGIAAAKILLEPKGGDNRE